MTRTLFTTALEKSLKAHQGDTVTLDDIRRVLKDRGFGLVLFLVSLICLVPLPWGGLVLGLLPAVVGFQLIYGLHEPWLPKWLRKRKVSKAKVLKMLDILKPYIQPIERLSVKSWPWMFNTVMDRVNGVLIVLASIPIILPAPLTNFFPAVALLAMAVALIVEDGRMLVVSWVLIGLACLMLLGLYGGLVAGVLLGFKEVMGM